MFKVSEIIKILNPEIVKISKKVNNILEKEIEKISIDTRKDVKNSLFIPLKGEKFDGHDFIDKALEGGAILTLTEKELNDNLPYIQVKDNLISFGKIAKTYIEKNRIKTIAITGTSGKTTLKEMLGYLTNFKIPEKSFNNLIGVPLTILEKGESDNYLILEFGTNRKGEIQKLTEIANPEYVIITNIGYAHTEGFSDINDYVKEKISILKSKNLKKAIVNWDNEFIKTSLKDFSPEKLIKFNSSQIINFSQNLEGSRYKILINGKIFIVESKLFGFHNAKNFLISLLLLNELGFNIEEAIEKFKYFTPVEMRFEIKKSDKGYFVINDCYNANFESFKASIETLTKLPKLGRKIVVAGDMLELGKYSEEIHRNLAEILKKSDSDVIIFVGNEIRYTYNSMNNNSKKKFYFNDKSLVIRFLKSFLTKDDIVLFKASRRLNFEKIIEEIF